MKFTGVVFNAGAGAGAGADAGAGTCVCITKFGIGNIVGRLPLRGIVITAVSGISNISFMITGGSRLFA